MCNPLIPLSGGCPGVPGPYRADRGATQRAVNPAKFERNYHAIRARAALRDLADLDPQLLAHMIVCLTGSDWDLAAAALESARLGHGLDESLIRALEASTSMPGSTP